MGAMSVFLNVMEQKFDVIFVKMGMHVCKCVV